MRTSIHPDLIAPAAEIQEADSILRACVHCGFCNATCPTYQLLGDELDGPRGRIYLIKNLLEHNDISAESTQHLDRCLTCRACETTCPSGVAYGRLLDIGRGLMSGLAHRPWHYRAWSRLLRMVIPEPWLFRPLLRLAQWLRPLLPRQLRGSIPPAAGRGLHQGNASAGHEHQRVPRQGKQKPDARANILLLGGCVQTPATPGVNQALATILRRVGQRVEILDAGCCGALEYHLSAREAGKVRMRALIGALYARLNDVDVIVSSATGCGVTVMEYADIFADEPLWQTRARHLLEKFQDAAPLVADFLPALIHADAFDLSLRTGLDNAPEGKPLRVSVHTPCSMQHGMKLVGRIEDILRQVGFELIPHKDSHLCCGSAGTYSILQPELSQQLLQNKLARLQEQRPDIIVTANIGCQLQLQSGASVPVMHWAELLARHLRQDVSD